MLRVREGYGFAGVQSHDSAVAQLHTALVLCVDQHILRQHLAERAIIRRRGWLHEHREHGGNDRRVNLRLRVPSQLLERFQHRGQNRHTA